MKRRARRILILANTSWDFHGRCGQLAEAWAAMGIEVEYVEPARYRGPLPRHLADRKPRPVPDGVRVRRSTAPMGRGVLFALWEQFRCAWLALTRPADLIVFYAAEFQLLAALAGRFRSRVVAYDLIDDWPSWSEHPREAALLARFFLPAAARIASRVIVTARLLAEDVGVRAAWVPNGVNDPPGELPHDHAGGEGAYFVGGIEPRIDIEWLANLARAAPSVPMTFAGDGPSRERLLELTRDLPNVSVPGAVPHDEAMAGMRRAAVCLIPYRRGRLTDRVFPIKLPEYWSAGKPVISVPAPEIERGGRGVVCFAQTGTEAAAHLQRLLADEEERAMRGQRGWRIAARRLNYAFLSKRFLRACGFDA